MAVSVESDQVQYENGKHCNECNVAFSFRKYRYHCRRCTKSFCYNHCNAFKTISGISKSVRVCGSCNDEPEEDDENETKAKDPFSEEDIFGTSSTPELELDSIENNESDTDSIDTEEEFVNEPLREMSPRRNDIPPFPLEPMSLSVVSYNVWMMPDRVTAFARSVSPSKHERALRIAVSLPKCDIIIFQEAFCEHSRSILLQAMAQRGYVHQSPVVGRVESGIRPLDGGVVLVSKFPILVAETKKFGSCCVGDDRLADKGVLYAKIEKNGQQIHVFATHTQAWNYKKAVRTRLQQFMHLRNFIQAKNIPSYEAVLVAGDLNVDRWDPVPLDDVDVSPEFKNEHERMLDTLRCKEAEYVSLDENKYSFNSGTNLLAAPGLSSDGACELLDYVLYSKDHRLPVESSTWICPLRATAAWSTRRKGKKIMIKDLSDHYPIMAKYNF